MANQPDIGDVIKNIAADAATIVKGEIELAKAEILPQAKAMGVGVGMFGAAGFLGATAASLLVISLCFGVAEAFVAWAGMEQVAAIALGFAIVAVLILIIAGVLAMIGKSRVTVGGPQAAVAQGQASMAAVVEAVERGKQDAELEVSARKAARQTPSGVSAG